MTSILFLDIDGVVRPYHKTNGKFDRECINVLNEIITETECDLVISCDWRLHFTLEELKHIFMSYGIKCPIDITTSVPYNGEPTEKERAKEIQMYVDSHDIDYWCAVDDLNLNMERSVFIREGTIKGITEPGAKQQVIDLLNHE